MTAAHTRAARCFALAHSTTYPGERDAAIGRGIAIAQAAGIDLDLFDIPGRAKSTPGPRFPRGQRAPDRYTAVEVVDLMRRYRATMTAGDIHTPPPEDVAAALRSLRASYEARAAQTGAAPDETVYEARRRNFHRATAEAAARDARRDAA